MPQQAYNKAKNRANPLEALDASGFLTWMFDRPFEPLQKIATYFVCALFSLNTPETMRDCRGADNQNSVDIWQGTYALAAALAAKAGSK